MGQQLKKRLKRLRRKRWIDRQKKAAKTKAAKTDAGAKTDTTVKKQAIG